MIEFGHLTHVGLRRDLNEDTYYGDSDLGLWLVAVLENYQRADGGVDIPAALQPYMGGMKALEPVR